MITMFDAKSLDLINLIDLQWVLNLFWIFKLKTSICGTVDFFSGDNQITDSVESSNVRSFIIFNFFNFKMYLSHKRV